MSLTEPTSPEEARVSVYRTLLLRLFVPRLLRNAHFTELSQVKAQRTYANVANPDTFQPVNPKPKRSTRPQALQTAAYPCSRCIATALILTTTEKEYTSQIETTLRGKSLYDYN